jgi:D-alanyl-D-alanine carboxypeptidase (penicillin-binding protein 5/6)
LIDYGFNAFKAYTVFKPGDIVESATTWEGVEPTVPLTIDQPVAVTLNLEERKGLKAVVEMPETVKAPIAVGDPIGKLVLSAPDLPPQEFPLHAAKPVERLGFFPRIAMAAHYMLGDRPSAKD